RGRASPAPARPSRRRASRSARPAPAPGRPARKPTSRGPSPAPTAPPSGRPCAASLPPCPGPRPPRIAHSEPDGTRARLPMRLVADNVWQLSGFPEHYFNVYLAGDVLIDCATRWARRRIFRQLAGRSLSLVALTHVHPDHQGVARKVCETYGVPLACHE